MSGNTVPHLNVMILNLFFAFKHQRIFMMGTMFKLSVNKCFSTLNVQLKPEGDLNRL